MKRLFLILLIVVSNLSWAQTQDIKDTIDINTIEVIGIRADNRTPVTKTNLDSKDIKLLNNYYEELPLFLNKTPNITSSTDGGHNLGYTYFRLRGIDQTRINMTMNGIPLNELEDQGVYFSNYPDFLTSMDNIQIQRGVGTTSNGTSSYGGSINFEAKNGNVRNTSIDVGGGSFNTKKFSIENSTGMINKFSFYTRFSKYATDGYKYNSGGTGTSFFLNGGYHGDKDVFKIIAFTGNSKNGMAWAGETYENIMEDPRSNSNTEREVDDFNQSLISLIYNRELNKNLFITANGFYNRLDGDWTLDIVDLLNFNLVHNYYGFSTNLNYNINNLDVILGFNTGIFERQHSGNFEPNPELLYQNTGFRNNYSTFLKVNYEFDNLNIFADIQYRYTNFSYEGDMKMDEFEWNFINPKFGVRYFLYDLSSVYASIGKTSREPTRTDIFGGEDNPETYDIMKPESVIDYEAGLDYNLDNVSFNLNGYFMSFEDELTHAGILGENGLPIMKNVESSYRTGLEFSLNWMIYQNENLSIDFRNNSVYSYNEVSDNGVKFKPLYTPDFIVNNFLNVNYKKVYISFENKIQDEVYIDWANENKLDGFSIYNVGLGWNFIGKNSINLKMNNLTDKSYFTNGYMAGSKYLYVNPPFNWYITLKINI